MSYDAEFETHDDYIRIYVTGSRRYGDAAVEAGEVGRRIVEYCRKANIYRVMTVLNLRGRLAAIDSFDIVTQSRDYGWDFKFKLALVDLNRDSAEDVKFTETVAVNRFYRVKAFSDEANALAWLLENEDGQGE